MVRWRRVILTVLPAVIIFVFAPLVVVTVASGQNLNTILALMLLLQLYVIIIQAEITMRQNALAAVQYEPTLVAVVERQTDPTNLQEQRVTKIRNVGRQPALNVFVSMVDSKTGELIKSGANAEQGGNLEPNSTLQVLSLSIQEYAKSEIQLRASYWNVLGEWKEATFLKPAGDQQFLTIQGVDLARGFFLRSLENLMLMYRFARFERYRQKTKGKATG